MSTPKKIKIHTPFTGVLPKGSLKLKKTKQEKREELARKKKIKEKKGGTLAGQIKRIRAAKEYKGDVKRIIK